ncbi:MAG: helix-turn-helix transcriptional regulator [Exilibacterium sp.]
MNFEKMTNSAVAEEIGRRIEQLRLERNITQDDLADAIGVTRKTYAKIEKGQCKLETLVAALRALGQVNQLEQLVPDTVFSPLELLKREGKKRQRARPEKADIKPSEIGW